MSATKQIEALVKLAPYLVRWTKPEVDAFTYIDDGSLKDMDVILEWGKHAEVFVDRSVITTVWIGQPDCYSRQSLDTWDGTLPPEFVEFMDTHFKREEKR